MTRRHKHFIFFTILILVILGLFGLWYEKSVDNEIILINNLTQEVRVACHPNRPCQYTLAPGKKALYQYFESLELTIGPWDDKHFYHLWLPNDGHYTLKISEIVKNKLPKAAGFKLQCSKFNDLNQAVTVRCDGKIPNDDSDN